MKRSDLIEELAAAIAAVRLPHPTRVGIDGVDAVGKTSLANELVEPLEKRGRHVVRASVDGFHHPKDIRYRRGSDSAEGYFFDSFNYPAVRSELLDPLGPQGTRLFRRAAFDYRVDRPVEMPEETANADTILLFDGVFLPGQLMYFEQCSPHDAVDILIDNADLEHPRVRYRRFTPQ